MGKWQNYSRRATENGNSFWPEGKRAAISRSFDDAQGLEAFALIAADAANGIWLDTAAAVGGCVRQKRA
jgi:hypothetical protein